ncbi:MAG: NAD(P)/FAD-dependent oxidoreductase [Armatimonadota bacterium]|nr:NAD(P)/FAD-dependent oxidoreductase [Armatimonadota bacterium]
MDTCKTDVALPHIVIVGGGFGGLQAALGLARAPVKITLVDRTNHHLFQPLLYQVATAGLSPGDITAPIRHILRFQQNVEVLMAEVTGIDTAARLVRMNDLSIPYDYLVLATGSQHSYFGHEEWGRFAPGLKTIADTTDIRRKILMSFEQAELEGASRDLSNGEPVEPPTFVLVGAGPTGVEMAGAIAELAHRALADDFRYINPKEARIILVEAAPRILGMFPERLARKAEAALERLGVEVRTGKAVELVDSEGIIVGGERIRSRQVLWTAGVKASPAAQWLGVQPDRAGRVTVGADLAVPSHENVYVIGDSAALQQDGKPLPALASVAMQQGRYVAGVLRSRVSEKPAPPPFRYLDKGSLATVGRSFAIFHLGPIQLSGFLAWILWLMVHIVFLIGFRNRVIVLFQWGWAYFTFQRAVRLIPPEPAREKAETEG